MFNISIYITGDCHANYDKIHKWYDRGIVKQNDYLIVCGDFGIWHDNKDQRERFNYLMELPFTILFCDGNHENFDLLNKYPVTIEFGGKVHRIVSNVYHLMRGEIYTIENKTFYVMGGASSHDIDDGILTPSKEVLVSCGVKGNYLTVPHEEFESKYIIYSTSGKYFRVNHVSWWKKELPCNREIYDAKLNLIRINYKCDYIITHCAPISIVNKAFGYSYGEDRLTKYFEFVKDNTEFKHWYFGHYHKDAKINDKFTAVYNKLYEVV